MAVMLNAMKEPKILMNHPVTRADSLENYYYYKQHYWDGVTYMDDRIVRTPFFSLNLKDITAILFHSLPTLLFRNLTIKFYWHGQLLKCINFY